MYSADTLSRIPRRDSKSLVPAVNLLDVNSIQEFVQRESLLSHIASSSDISLSRLKKYIVSGPNTFLPTCCCTQSPRKNILFKMVLFSMACISYHLLTYNLTFYIYCTQIILESRICYN